MGDKKRFISAVPYAILAVFVLFVTWPVFKDFNTASWGDWDQHCFFDEGPRKTILEYGQLPLWNPYSSGGRPALGNPQYNFLRPAFVLTLAFGCNTGQRFELFLMLLVGAAGMFWLLTRHYKTTALPGVFAGVLFALSGYMAMHMLEWHSTFLPLMLGPWAYFFYLRSEGGMRAFILGGATFGLMILGGGVVYAYVPFGVFLLVHSLADAVRARSGKPFLRASGMLVLALLLAAMMTVPMADYLREHRRPISPEREGVSLKGLLPMFLVGDPHIRSQNDPPVWIVRFEGQKWAWAEYSAYIGLLPFLFFFAGIFLFWRKESSLLVAGFVGLLIAMGVRLPFGGLWSLLFHVPFFESIRAVSRFIILFVFTLSVIVGIQTSQSLRALNKRRWLRYALVFLIIFCIVDILLVSNKTMGLAFLRPLPELNVSQEFRQAVDPDPWQEGSYSNMYFNLLENKGTINAFDPVPHTAYAVGYGEPGYRGEVYLDGNGTAEYALWSPNRLVVKVNAPEPARVVINQNFDKSWRADAGTPESFNGLLSIKVPGGESRVTFHYLPSSFIVGALVSALSIAGTIVAWRKFAPKPRKRRR